jgi:asparagine synthase (glutamine-hydrolysing)
MCGIWGIVNVADREMAEAAARAMHHRGPDDHGVLVLEEPIPVSLANTRLAIIDLSPAAHQPMSNKDGSLWIVYNGEIYNYRALRTILLDMGYQFVSQSDTEVVLHAYDVWGEGCLEHFRGMFAFAIWDAKRGRLFAARDRLGIKPLYYVHDAAHKMLLFGSELKALLASGLVKRRLSYAGLHHYLSFYAVPAPHTMLEDVQALPTGHSLTFQDGRLTLSQYWNIPPAEPLEMSTDEILVRLRSLLEDAVRLRMVADVPVGAFLSGGIDSSAVVALMTRISGERLKTFSVGFGPEGRAQDERSEARVLAEYYGTDHHEVIVTGAHVRDQLDNIVRAMDQPTGDGLNTYLVSQATAEHVKVAVSGLGGDELFAGYPQFGLFHRAQAWDRLPGVVRAAARAGAQVVGGKAWRAVQWLDGDFLTRYGRVRVLYDEQAKLELYTPETQRALAAPEPSLKFLAGFVHPVETDPLAQLTRLELKNYMAHTLLRDTDAMSLAHSLEVRVPLIDHKLVEFAMRIPFALKLHDGTAKWIFIQALRDVLPPEVARRPKRGFEMPVEAWMRGELRPILDDVFSEQGVAQRGLFRYEVVNGIYERFLDGSEHYMRVWALAALELWLRQYVG